ncbi:MAG TPA: hypothetical protein PL045_13210 [Chitinophagaceae bacterium]|nr:hypothetical protein [Chitinophagaceae bacterium]
MNHQLPGFILTDLYKDSLVITGIPERKKTETTTAANKNAVENTQPPPAKKIWLGENKKGIAILVNDAATLHIKEEHLETLGKLLEALNMNIADTAIINLAHNPININWLQTELQPKYIFLFDADTQQIELPFAIPDYQVQKYAGCIIMSASAKSLSPGKTDKTIVEEKKKLWQKLKEIFGV